LVRLSRTYSSELGAGCYKDLQSTGEEACPTMRLLDITSLKAVRSQLLQ
jgi:hypothetical protein